MKVIRTNDEKIVVLFDQLFRLKTQTATLGKVYRREIF